MQGKSSLKRTPGAVLSLLPDHVVIRHGPSLLQEHVSRVRRAEARQSKHLEAAASLRVWLRFPTELRVLTCLGCCGQPSALREMLEPIQVSVPPRLIAGGQAEAFGQRRLTEAWT